MKVILQRVNQASVEIENAKYAKIGQGILILLGIEANDDVEDIDYLVKKITQLRIFSDIEGKMNLSCENIQGDYLVVSQFTLFANTKKGNRPSYTEAARPEIAIPLYEKFVQLLNQVTQNKVKTGQFGADMQISLVNSGPVTILIDSKRKK